MKVKPLIVGAFLLAPVVGAFAGQKMSTDPISSIADVSSTLPNGSTFAASDPSPRTSERLPDHYAMETPEGRVEVHELAMRGRYSDRYEPYQQWRPDVDENLAMVEYQWDDETLDRRAEQALSIDEADDTPTSRYEAPEAANYTALESARTGEVAVAPSVEPTPALELREPAEVSPRVIDVQAALEGRR